MTDIYVSEEFINTQYGTRGWYSISSDQRIIYDADRNKNVLQIKYPIIGAKSGYSLRHSIPDTDTVHVRYYVKYSSNWEWTYQMYGPHEIQILTNQQDAYAGQAITNLTVYIEANNGKPHLVLQDALNIDQSRINQDLSDITENRAIAGGNGNGNDNADYCGYYYSSDYKMYLNAKGWKSTTPLIHNNQWYLVEASFKMNSIVNGKAVADGHVKYWLNNTQVINSENVILRTGQHSDMKFKYILIAPYFHSGVYHSQYFCIDSFMVSDGYIGGSNPAVNNTIIPIKTAPTGLSALWFKILQKA